MDTFTHGITGALIGKSLAPQKESRLVILAVTLGSIFPDTDFFSNLFVTDRLARLEVHRGVTHSLVALPAFALLFGLLTCLWTRKRRWLFYSSLYAAGIASHILLDVITSYGTMVWAPLSNVRVAWDTVFIIDLILTSIVLLPQLTAWTYASPSGALRRGSVAWLLLTLGGFLAAGAAVSLELPFSSRVALLASACFAILLGIPAWGGRGFRWRRGAYCRAGVGALAGYLLLCSVAHRAALARVEAFAEKTGATVERLAALPSPPSLWYWSGLVQTPEGVYRIAIQLGERSAPASRFFANAEKNSYVERAEDLADVKTYRWFARFPWVTYFEENGFHIIEYRDVQFFLPRRQTNSPFTLRVALDDQGNVISSALLQP